MAAQTGQKNRGNTGRGRPKGSLNKTTLVGKTVSDTFKNFLGLDDEAVARTGMIDGKGYGARERIRQMARCERSVDPAYSGFLRLLLAYAYGTPIKMAPQVSDRRTLNFITSKGLPWLNDPLAQKEAEMLAASERDEANLAEQRALEAANPIDDDPDGLKVVR